MNYIVFDLEWNQSPGGKRWSNSRLPFEIIEIGAIKLNEEKEIVEQSHQHLVPACFDPESSVTPWESSSYTGRLFVYIIT